MTFQQYIDNPLGKKNAVFSQRDMFKAMYTEKFGAVNLREAGNVKYILYKTRGDIYYCHIKVPSEVVPKFYYDVVVRFSTTDNGLRTSNSLADYDVRFFSNDPAFCYTYLRVFLKNDMFVEELKPKAPKEALRKDPEIRNPYGIPGYVKSIYFAFLYMKKFNLFTKNLYRDQGIFFNKNALLNDVEHADKKIADRQREGERVAKETKKARTTNARRAEPVNNITTDTTRIKPTSGVKNTKAVKFVKGINPIKKVGTPKTVKRIK